MSVTLAEGSGPRIITADLFDGRGERVGRLLNGETITGRRLIDLAPLDLNRGLYFLRVADAGSSVSVPIIAE